MFTEDLKKRKAIAAGAQILNDRFTPLEKICKTISPAQKIFKIPRPTKELGFQSLANTTFSKKD